MGNAELLKAIENAIDKEVIYNVFEFLNWLNLNMEENDYRNACFYTH